MYKLNVTDMHCMSCVRNIEDALKDQDRSVKITANIEQREIQVESSLEEAIVIKIIQDEGYNLKD